jgi:hypothetical protein
MIEIDGKAMETPVSMMLLISTALLIGSIMIPAPDEGDDGTLQAIRMVQALSLSTALANHRNVDGEDVAQLVGKAMLEVWRGKVGEIDFSRDPGGAGGPIRDILARTPDDLEVSILFSRDVNDIPDLVGARFSSRTELAGGLFLTVTLPHHRGSMHQREVSA